MIMKKILNLIVMVLISSTLFSQEAPWTMSYQAIVRNSANQLLQNTQVGVRVSIGDTLYAETHTATTNINGILELEIGAGTQVYGWFPFEYIPWANGPYYLKTEIDPEGGTNYTISSTSKMMSVPHSNYSHWSGVLVGWASLYTGVYQNVEEDEMYLSISYLSTNKVLIEFFFDQKFSLIGSATPDMIDIPLQLVTNTETVYGTAILSNDILTLTFTWVDNSGSDTFTLTLQRIQ